MSDVIDLIYEAAIDDDAFSKLAAEIARDGRYESALVLLRKQIDLIEGSFEIDPNYLQPYVEYYARIDPWAAASMRAPKGRIVIGDEIAPERELIETEFYRDFARHQGTFEPMGITLPIGPDLTLGFAVNRPRGSVRFAEADQAWMRSLAPHLRRMMEMRRRLQPVRAADKARRSLLDGLLFGVVFVDAEGRVRAANAAAEDLLRAGHLIRQSKGRLVAARRPDADRLAALFRDVANGGSGGAMRILDARSVPALAVLVSPAPPSLQAGESRSAMVTLQQVEGDAIWPEAMLAQMFDLSRAEAGLLAAFANGHAIEEIARLRRVSLTTVRTQLRSVFRKTGTLNQSDLMRVIGMIPRVRG